MVPVERARLARGAAPVLGTQICPAPAIQGLSPVVNRAPHQRVSRLSPATSRRPNPHPVNLPRGVFSSRPVGRGGRGVRCCVCAYRVSPHRLEQRCSPQG